MPGCCDESKQDLRDWIKCGFLFCPWCGRELRPIAQLSRGVPGVVRLTWRRRLLLLGILFAELFAFGVILFLGYCLYLLWGVTYG